ARRRSRTQLAADPVHPAARRAARRAGGRARGPAVAGRHHPPVFRPRLQPGAGAAAGGPAGRAGPRPPDRPARRPERPRPTGGVVLALLDEAMAWAAIASAGRFAVVRETTTTFEHGVLVGQSYRVEAEVETAGSIRMSASARVVDERGRRCARARARLVVLSQEAAKEAIGEVTGDDTRFLRREKT